MVEGAVGKVLLQVAGGMLMCVTPHCSLLRLGLLRDAEKQFKSALGNGQFVDIYLFLAKVYVKLDQPLTALDVLKKVTQGSIVSSSRLLP